VLGAGILVKPMKRFILLFFCIAAISGAVFYAVSVPHEPLARAEDGVLDMRGAGGGVYRLGGAWEFYWGRHYGPDDFAGDAPPEPAFIPVPSAWNNYGHPRRGCATYRLTVLTPPEARLLLYVPEILSAGVVWVNGAKVFSAGEAGKGKDSFRSYDKSALVSPKAGGGVWEIVVQAANYEKVNGGLRHAFRLGLGEAENPLIPPSFFGQWFLVAGVAAVFFAIAFYHMASYILRRGENNLIYLLFGVNCLVTGLRLLVDQNGPAQFFIDTPLLNPHLSMIYLLLTALSSIVIIIFSIIVFEAPSGRAARPAFAVMLGLPLLLMLTLPPPYSRAATALYVLPFIVMVIFAAKSLSWAKIQERPYLGLYFAALLFFTVWGAVFSSSPRAPYFAGFIFQQTLLALAQFVMLSQEYGEAQRKTRELAAKNDFYHRMAHDLLTPLTIVSTNIQVAGLFSEKAPELLKKAQAEIMGMAGTIEGALDESWDKDGGDR
jgi:hypothetical protein